MGLLRKVRVLIGAWARRPFMPRPEKVELAEEPSTAGDRGARASKEALETPEQRVRDGERVADLIARQREAD